MKIGIVVPQGWSGEFHGWDPARAWRRTVAIAQHAEALGFESVWAFDHFETNPTPTDELTFESFATLTALAAVTRRVRLGHLVICAGFRNPALTAKMIGTMDVISGGRMELGIGAGWHEPEWRAFGYPFPPLRERMAMLADHLEIIGRMLGPGRATYSGRHASVEDAINLPRGLQEPRIPLMVGGNGPKVTWRLAARHADELNLDGLTPDDVARAMPVIRERCTEIGRDPATLPVSNLIWSHHEHGESSLGPAILRSYAETGLSRVMLLLTGSVESDAALTKLADDARRAGLPLTA